VSVGQAGEPPVITVTRGGATPAEIAVITAVLLAVRAAAASMPPAGPAPARPGWAARSRALTVFPYSGLGGWRASGLPH
jgi:hypothetical protein